MRDDPKVRRLSVLAVVAGGLLLGHALSYLVAVPDPHSREALLERTGHAYIPFAAQVALILALASAAILAMRAVAGRAADLGPGARGLAPKIASIQVSAFVTLELVERWSTGAGFADLLNDHLLALGVVAQIATAIAGASVLRWVWRTAVRAGSFAPRAGRRRRPVGALLPIVFRPCLPPRVALLASTSAPRAPPGP
jgi:hypothetical protein